MIANYQATYSKHKHNPTENLHILMCVTPSYTYLGGGGRVYHMGYHDGQVKQFGYWLLITNVHIGHSTHLEVFSPKD